MVGLYVHVPFCKFPKCPYCGFYSVKYDKRLARDYAAACVSQIREYGILYGLTALARQFDTVYFGGGTPSLAPEVIETVMGEIAVTEGAEVSAECNPDTVTDELCMRLRAAGVNRVSIGVQSFDDGVLKFLGRAHSASDNVRAITCAARYFDNISADFILTGQPVTGNRRLNIPKNVSEILTHISAYMLEHWNEPDGDLAADEYLAVCGKLEAAGFKQYEISNFAKIGHKCLHNLNYWRYGDWLGIGAAAHSHIDGKRFYTKESITNFTQSEYIQDDNTEKIIMGLRLVEGIPEKWIDKQKTKTVSREFICTGGGRVFLTRRGMCVQNAVLAKLI